MDQAISQKSGFDQESLPVFERCFNLPLDEYISTTAAAWETTPLKQERSSFGCVGRYWVVGRCMFFDYTLSPLILEMTKAHLQNGGPAVTFERYVDGFEYGERGGEDRFDGPGVINLFGQDKAIKQIATATRRQEIIIPKDMVGLLPTCTVKSEHISATSWIGKSVFAEWDLIFDLLKAGRSEIAASVLQGLATSLKIALGVPIEREDVRAQARDLVFRKIQRFIQANLQNPNLSTDLVLQQHGVSRASLYRMFDAYGGIRNYITQARAANALMEVWQSGMARGQLNAALERWQFSTPSNFNRTVRRLFGNSPGRLFQESLQANPDFRLISKPSANYVHHRWGSKDPASLVAQFAA